MLKEFKEFAFKGNVVDLAVGVMIGGAFAKIVSSLVDNLFMPIISLLTNGINFADLFIPLDGNSYASLAAAEAAGAAAIKYGLFITAVLDFFLIAICVFLFVKLINRLRSAKKAEEPEAPKEPDTKLCPYCKTDIPIGAVRCPHCTSELG